MASPAVHHPLFARLWSLMSRHEPPEIRRHRDERRRAIAALSEDHRGALAA